MKNQKKISVAIIDSHKSFAIELSKVINAESDLNCTQIYINAEEATTFLQNYPVDIVLLNINLPYLDEHDFMSSLKRSKPEMEFCILTEISEDSKVLGSFKRGAKGYLLKEENSTMIISSIRLLREGGSPMSPTIARKVIDSYSKTTPQNVIGDHIDLPLSPREKEIMGQLSKGLQYKEISSLLQITTGTVKQHIHKIYNKLQVSNKTEAINLFLSRK